jgi:hypothetical protein
MIFLDFISSHCVQTHAVFAFLGIGANAHESCAVRQRQALLFQQATAHSLRVTSRHMAALRKHSVSQHGSQANVLQTSMSSTTVNKCKYDCGKDIPTTHSNASSTHTEIYKICKCMFMEVTQKYAYPFI